MVSLLFHVFALPIYYVMFMFYYTAFQIAYEIMSRLMIKHGVGPTALMFTVLLFLVIPPANAEIKQRRHHFITRLQYFT